MTSESGRERTGGCLCGSIRYRLQGPLRHVICCHCENCRRTHGHYAAYTALDRACLQLTSDATLVWYHDASPDTYRGFCNRCGASLFWDAGKGSERISVAAGTLDDASGLKTVGHIFLAEAGHYYAVDENLPCYEEGSGGELEADTDG